jgi:hypothetical protein
MSVIIVTVSDSLTSRSLALPSILLNFGTAVVNRFTTADGMLLINTPLLGYNFDTNALLTGKF